MPGFQHYVSGVPEPFCRCRCRSTVAGVPFPLPFRAEATELDGNHFPLTMNVKQRYSLGKVQSRYILLPLFGLTPRRRGRAISVKFSSKGHRWSLYQMA